MSVKGGNLIVALAVLVVLVTAVSLVENSTREPNIGSTLNSSNATIATLQDCSLTVLLNGTFSGQLSVPALIAEGVKEYFGGINATLYSFEVEVIGDSGMPRAGITLHLLRIVPPFEPEDFEVFINAKQVSGETYVSVYPHISYPHRRRY